MRLLDRWRVLCRQNPPIILWLCSVMSVVTDRINVLTYHAIADGPGPTNIPADTFRGQMLVLRECGYTAISLAEFAAWHAGEVNLAPRSVVITFDDGFASFAEHAFPELAANNWTATVFLPVAYLGTEESWLGADPVPRRLLTWDQVAELASAGIDFGSHSRTHRDLRRLGTDELRLELAGSRDEIEHRLKKTPLSFAPPYGRTNRHVREAIGELYRMSVGTRLQRAGRTCNLLDVPRIEMHYFRDLRRWRAYLEGRAEWFFLARRSLRGIRALAASAVGA